MVDQGAYGDQTVTITVTNSAPQVTPITPQTVNVGDYLSFPVQVQDPEFVTLTLRNNPPPSATVDTTSRVFSWTPVQQGNFTITIRVADPGGLYNDVQFSVTVNP